MFKKFSQVGRAMMLPIAILPAAGLLLGFGGALTNPSTLAAYPFLDIEWLQTILSIMSFAGNAVFANLALIFTIGVAVGLANGDKGTAGLATDPRCTDIRWYSHRRYGQFRNVLVRLFASFDRRTRFAPYDLSAVLVQLFGRS